MVHTNLWKVRSATQSGMAMVPRRELIYVIPVVWAQNKQVKERETGRVIGMKEVYCSYVGEHSRRQGSLGKARVAVTRLSYAM